MRMAQMKLEMQLTQLLFLRVCIADTLQESHQVYELVDNAVCRIHHALPRCDAVIVW